MNVSCFNSQQSTLNLSMNDIQTHFSVIFMSTKELKPPSAVRFRFRWFIRFPSLLKDWILFILKANIRRRRLVSFRIYFELFDTLNSETIWPKNVMQTCLQTNNDSRQMKICWPFEINENYSTKFEHSLFMACPI